VLGDIEKILIDRAAIARRVAELGAEIGRDLDDLHPQGEIILVPVLTGSIIFVADLIRQLPHKIKINVVTVTSYPGKSMKSRGAQVAGALPADLEGKHVLIVDDILDSGGTIRALKEVILARRPRSLWTCVLLRKAVRAAMETTCEYVGFDIPDEFVVGYGLDYDNYYRNLPDVATLKREVM
jgi:hypoxanthine phosphoribosyltransferase